MDATKRCVACAMDLRDEATRCPHCQAVQPGAVMHRGGEGRKLLGVCLALSRQFGLDVALVRVAFIIALVVTFGATLMVYGLLWAFTPPSPIGKAPVQRVVDWMSGPADGSAEPKVERRV
ncbi:PspC domain-containing protein [Hyalangium versicolor]|uniref:PspC domain-containing protein n=1 Tax=Hyalangium versicolor TaxID=2861190 RepID=UPI001CCD12F8|nr:PspC domain-containing protein [Hyalangium versicolor]